MLLVVKRVAVNQSQRKAGAIALLYVLPANPHKKRADERTRTADLISLRESCSYWTSNPLYTTLVLGPSIALLPRSALSVYTFYLIPERRKLRTFTMLSSPEPYSRHVYAYGADTGGSGFSK